jgi:hypothetical protein
LELAKKAQGLRLRPSVRPNTGQGGKTRRAGRCSPAGGPEMIKAGVASPALIGRPEHASRQESKGILVHLYSLVKPLGQDLATSGRTILVARLALRVWSPESSRRDGVSVPPSVQGRPHQKWGIQSRRPVLSPEKRLARRYPSSFGLIRAPGGYSIPRNGLRPGHQTAYPGLIVQGK